ncbi:reverse transcriptase, partial [Fagus crenata]
MKSVENNGIASNKVYVPCDPNQPCCGKALTLPQQSPLHKERTAIRHNVADTKVVINKLLLDEEIHWRQRLHMVWLAIGDCNTKFFHHHAHQRRQTNKIMGLMTEEGQVEEIVVSYFEDLFHTTYPVNLRETLSAMESTITVEANQTLLHPYTEDE